MVLESYPFNDEPRGVKPAGSSQFWGKFTAETQRPQREQVNQQTSAFGLGARPGTQIPFLIYLDSLRALRLCGDSCIVIRLLHPINNLPDFRNRLAPARRGFACLVKQDIV